jgi:Domain of unknown function (DUF222)
MSTTVLPPLTHPVLSALRAVGDGLDELADANLWSLSDAEALEVLAESQRLLSRMTGVALRATRDVDTRGAAVTAGATSLTAWLVNVARLHPGEAARQVRLAAALDRDLPDTADALAAGAISVAAATVIADTDEELRTCATAVERAEAQTVLVEHARVLNVRQLQAAALHVRHQLDPERGSRLEREERGQVARREFRLLLNPDGSSRPDGYLDKEATALLRTALEPLAAPRPADKGRRDPRTSAQRTGDALVELVELALRCGELPAQAGQPVQLVVTMSLEDLESRLGSTAARGTGELDLGLPLSVEATRRLACDCQVVPAVLGGHGEPLNLGRAMRTASLAIRRALDVRDGGCAFPGCDRPPRWCHVHHIWHWADGGPTSCANCVLLCRHHHSVVHHDGWDVEIALDGLPTFYPPAWIDPDRQPRRNHRLRPHPPPPRPPR